MSVLQIPSKASASDNYSSVSSKVPDTNAYIDYFADYQIYYVGSFGAEPFPEKYFSFISGDNTSTYTHRMLRKLGYSFKFLGDCLVELSINNNKRLIECSPHNYTKKNSILDSVKI